MQTPSDSTHSFETLCRRLITGDPAYFPQAKYRGQTIYFCTEFCLHAFQDDPERFLEVHSQEEK
jgi:YHS domain-containing protein